MTKFRDNGPWSLFTGSDKRIGVISEDFTHDVVLWISGDFSSGYDKMYYAKELVEVLNSQHK